MAVSELLKERHPEKGQILSQGSLHGTDLVTLHICDSGVDWSICGTPGNVIKDVPGALAGSWDPIPHALLSCLVLKQGQVIGFMTT